MDAEPLKIIESTSLGTQFTKQRNMQARFYLFVKLHIEMIYKRNNDMGYSSRKEAIHYYVPSRVSHTHGYKI